MIASSTPHLTLVESSRCRDCPFLGVSLTAGTSGPSDAPIAIIGEAPGAAELRQDRPFVGPSGQLLRQALAVAGVSLDDCFLTNALSCRPPSDPIPKRAIDACHARALGELTAHPRAVVISLGGVALRSLIGSDAKITRTRGQAFRMAHEAASLLVLPTIHPAAVLREGSQLASFQQDIRRAADLAAGRAYDAGETRYTVIESEADVGRALRGLAGQQVLSLDIETASLSRWQPILAVGIAWAKNKVLIFPWGTVIRYRDRFALLFASPTIRWVFHNGQFDTSFLIAQGFPIRIAEDTILLQYLLDESAQTHSLKALAAQELGVHEWRNDIELWLGQKLGGANPVRSSFQIVPRPVLYRYLSYDADNTLQLYHRLAPRVAESPGLTRAYQRILIPGSNFLRGVEMRGLWIDEAERERLRDETETRASSLLRGLRDIAADEGLANYNPASVPQVADMIYRRLRLQPRPEEARYFSGSTARLDLERLEDHPFITAQLAYRRHTKALGTYINGIEKFIAPDGRVHSTYLLYRTKTGRIASREPNLQNITRVLDESIDPNWINVKRMFSAPPGRVLIELDYSQAELRTLAVLSHDPLLLDVYGSGRDLHNEVSVRLFGPNYTQQERDETKRVNFGIIYGLTAPSLARQFKRSIAYATDLVNGWFDLFPVARTFLDRCASQVTQPGYIQTPLGRIRRAGLVTPDNRHALSNEFRNAPIQSIASDMTLLAGVYAELELAKLDAGIVNIVHDSLVVECADNPATIQRVIRYVTEHMESVPTIVLHSTIPFTVGVKAGQNWGRLAKV